MSVQFSVLASGSSGNASLLEVNGFGLLIDAGLGPRLLAARLSAVGATWQRIDAVILTHTHTDHWKDRTLAHLRRLRIPLYCHREHHTDLLQYSSSFAALRMANLVRDYDHSRELALGPGISCRSLPLRHDGTVTSGFRFELLPEGAVSGVSVAYAADLGSWPRELAQTFADVDLLALEFNHDVPMQYASGRPQQLIDRVLGDHGHLSNEQAAELVREVIRVSQAGRLQYLVQLHLSRECNLPELAVAARRKALEDCEANVQVHTARQHQAGPLLRLGTSGRSGPHLHVLGTRAKVARSSEHTCEQPWLPGWDDSEMA